MSLWGYILSQAYLQIVFYSLSNVSGEMLFLARLAFRVGNSFFCLPHRPHSAWRSHGQALAFLHISKVGILESHRAAHFLVRPGINKSMLPRTWAATTVSQGAFPWQCPAAVMGPARYRAS